MITGHMIKTEFIHRIVTRDFKIINDTQQSVFNEFFTGGTDRMASYLWSKPFTLTISSEHIKTLHVRVLSYLRLLDIRYRKKDKDKRQKLAPYNRVVWGVLYHETLPSLKCTFTKETRQKIGSKIRGMEQNKQQTVIHF